MAKNTSTVTNEQNLNNANSTAGATKPPKHRSPNFPSISLSKAIEKVSLLHVAFRSHPAPVANALIAMKYNPEGSTGQQALAAVKAFGLVEVNGVGRERKVKVSDRGLRIIGNHPSKADLIREAALLPHMNREVWEHFCISGDGLIDEPVRVYLEMERQEGRFNPDAIAPFLAQLKATALFAGLDSPRTLIEDADCVTNSDVELDFEESAEPVHRNAKPNSVQSVIADLGDRRVNPSDLPLPLVMPDGSIRVVHIPTMTETMFTFFKMQLEAYKAAIVREKTSTDFD